MLHFGTLLKLTIVPHFQAMFPISSSAIKYLCANYTILFDIGDKRLGGHPSSEETRAPPLWKKGKSPQPKKSRRRKT
ncbi:hypothetical protein AB205_0096580 [Aquarana catesbeiana]|uniref:Uncharacterized protein n=1 Tax=Aquarana catesbeiana TaxID=8400 RepID=A0A2G9Q4Y8_AQUCT|nr:hypothetical protein AB205_0096580 [Aquarana catesbeiana]